METIKKEQGTYFVYLADALGFMLIVGLIAVSLWALVHCWNRPFMNTTKRWTWLVLIFLLPGIGAFFYWLLNRRRRKK